MLVGKLQEATIELKKVVKPQFHSAGSSTTVTLVPKRVKYAWNKEVIAKSIHSIQLWKKEFDPTWFLMLRMSDKRVSSEIDTSYSRVIQSIPSSATIRSNHGLRAPSSRGLTLPAAALERMQIREIRFSSAKVARSLSPMETDMYILNSFGAVDLVQYQASKKSVRDLASSLQHDEPDNFGLLSCKGFISEADAPSKTKKKFTLVFRIPPNLWNPRSFREYLISTSCPSSLSCRFDIAKDLAKAVSYVHTFGFVHKNIRPETILCFDSSGKASPSIFLIGFDNFRKEDGRTQQRGDNEVEKNLYRHPSRQGFSPESTYIMQHDIYSLGVCLLEIGLWQSFIEYENGDHNPSISPTVGLPNGASDGVVSSYLLSSCKERLVSVARSTLEQRMGTKYANVVHTCLTCLDPDNNDFGDEDEFEDDDGIQVGVRYIEKVRLALTNFYAIFSELLSGSFSTQ